MISCNGSNLAYGRSPPTSRTSRPCCNGANVPRPGNSASSDQIESAHRGPTADRKPNEQARPQHNPAPGDRRLRAVVLRHPALPLDHLRRPDPVQGEALRDQGPLQRGDPAGPAVRRAHLRRLGRQGAGHRPRAQRRSRRWPRSTSTTSTAPLPSRHAGDPAHQDAARRDLHRTDSRQLATAPSSPTAAPCPRRRSPNRSSSTRSSAPSTPKPAPPSRPGSRKRRSRSRARAPSLSYAFGELEPTFTDFDHLFRVLDSQRLAVKQLFRNGATTLRGAARPPGRARRPDRKLERRLQHHRRPRPRHRSALPRLPDLPGRVETDPQPAQGLRRQRRPGDEAAGPGRRTALADPDRLLQAGAASKGLLRRPRTGDRPRPDRLPGACASSSATSSHRCCAPPIPSCATSTRSSPASTSTSTS